MKRSIAIAAGIAATAATLVPLASPSVQAEAQSTVIEVLSNRADLVSGGDALIAITGRSLETLTVLDDDRDVTSSFSIVAERLVGLVDGLDLGDNVLTATQPDGSGASLTVTNHPNGGPIFSGPQRQPWKCTNGGFDLQCNKAPVVTYQYRSTGGAGWSSYNPASPATDVATTITDQGNQVPLVIRTEVGYQNRDQYRITSLVSPAGTTNPARPYLGYNGKILINHGASCGIDHQSASAPATTGGNLDVALEMGYATMSTALNNAGHNCNIITQAESLVMAKERIAETVGPIRFSIGTGCSGGSLTQQQVANAYPGIYQGILPQCSFPDAWSTGQQLVDYHLLRRYFENPTKWGTVWAPNQIAAVEGHPNHVNAIVLDQLYLVGLGDPTNPCAGTTATVAGDESTRYHPQTNPGGVRCTLADVQLNVLGAAGPTAQNPDHAEFAGRPLDNVGVQYGLNALRDGTITASQFVDVNAVVGGADLDIAYTAARTPADRPALANAYRSGAINVGNNLDQVAIIDLRGPDHGAFHDAYRTWATRARIEREFGNFDNHVIWFGHAPLLGDPGYTTEAFLVMDEWLAGVEADDSDAGLASKIVTNRPSDLEDRCSQVEFVETVEVSSIGRVCELKDLQARYGTPRMVAGEGVETDINKCTLKPHRRQDYYPMVFSDAEWARLDAAFPGGVCDFTAPAVDWNDKTIPWLTYQTDVIAPDGAGGSVMTGGAPLGDVPASVEF